MMQAPRPIDGNVTQPMIKLQCTIQRSSSVESAEVKEAVEDRAIVSHVKLVILLFKIVGGRLLVLQVDAG